MNQQIRILALLILFIVPYSRQAQAQCDYTLLFDNAKSAYAVKDYDKAHLRLNAILSECDGLTYAQKQEIQSWIAKVEEAKNPTNANTSKPDPFAAQMVQIRGGTFMMGSPASEAGREGNETQHQVTLSDFKMSKYEVTQAQWVAVMGSNPSEFKGCDNCPVEQVNWNDIQEFLRKLNALTGKNYRLPTEAEWEYACRAGTSTPFSTGNNLSTAQANYNGDYPYNGNAKGVFRQKTTPVGSFSPNAWSLYDMHGNVFEWCSDWYGDYPTAAQTNPKGSSTGTQLALRGSSWFHFAKGCRSAYRGYAAPTFRYNFIGFRLASF